jgi:signal transduction histidine kinase
LVTSSIVGSGVLLINFNSGMSNLEKRLDDLVDLVSKSKDDQVSVALDKVREQEISLAYREVDGTITVLQDSAGEISADRTSQRTLSLADGESLIFSASQESVYQSFEKSLSLTLGLSLLAALASAVAVWLLMARDLSFVLQLIRDAKEIAGGKRTTISNRKASKELGELSVALSEMVNRLRESKEQLQDFLSDASHELRTPVTVIRGYLEILAKEKDLDSEQAKRAIDRAQDSTLKMQALIADLLRLAELGELPEIQTEAVWLSDIYKGLLEDFQRVQPNRVVEVNDKQTSMVRVSKDMLDQFFSNAFSNLMAHTPEDAAVRIGISQSIAGMQIEIDDAGPGIDEISDGRALKAFKRFDENRTKSKNGSGLGLSIMAKIIDLHQGQMTLSRSDLGGLRVSVFLPNG